MKISILIGCIGLRSSLYSFLVCILLEVEVYKIVSGH